MTTKALLFTLMHDAGCQRLALRGTLPDLALTLAGAAKQGAIDEGDVMDLYLAYMQASHPRRKLAHSDPPVKANASKLRQIVKAQDPELLKRVTEVHQRLVSHETPCKALYACMVDACRAALLRPLGKPLSERAIVKLCKR
jgi:hypothetical protein